MIIKLDLDSIDDYLRFIQIKQLPRYSFQGRTAWFPDEYADRLGLAVQSSADAEYKPIDGLFDYQRDIAGLAIRRKKFAAFVRPGLGKTLIGTEFARHAVSQLGSSRNVLIISPPMVIKQTMEEVERFYGGSLSIQRIRASELADWTVNGSGVGITNYEGLKPDVPQGRLGALIADESSLLKSHYGKWGQEVIRLGKGLDWKLCLTGTPAPNDRIEFANHAVFLDAFPTINSFLAKFFINRGQTQERWEMKPHAVGAFYKALSHWSIFMSNPATYGWKDNCGTIPPVHVHIHDVDLTDAQNAEIRKLNGSLFTNHVGGIGDRSKLARIAKGGDSNKPAFIRSLIESWPDESTLVWCRFNDEQARLAAEIPGAASISGSTPDSERERIISRFQSGEIKVLVSKAKIMGFGLNMQVCTRQVFSSCHDCYDEKTEILTSSGWRLFGDVSVGDSVATVSPETRVFEWQDCSRVVWEPYSGPMIRFQGQRNFDLLVTPNHKLFVERCKVRFPNDQTRPSLKKASDLIERYRRSEYRMFSTASGFIGDSIPCIEIPPYGERARCPNSKSVDRITTRDFAMLVGWYVSEGYCRPIDSYEFGRIVICQTDVHPENRVEIISLLKRIGLSVNDKTKDLTSYSRRLAKFLMDEFGTSSGTMRIPGWVKNLDIETLTIIRDTMIKGDACHSGGTPRCYRTTSKQLADDFQEICVKTGVRGSVHARETAGCELYDVCLAWDNINPSIYNEPEVVQYEGMIGCVTVPNHIVIVRRNGIPVVSGNSYEEYFQAVMRSNRVGSTRPLNVHLPVTEAERPMMENVLRKADRIEEDTRIQEQLFKEMALATA